jgi:hypothetical protein
MTTLFEHNPSPQPPAHHNAPKGTSELAAASVVKSVPELRRRVLDAIASAGAAGLTDEQGEVITGIRHQTYTPRRLELQRQGLIRDSGERRKTASGRNAAVWVATEDAR